MEKSILQEYLNLQIAYMNSNVAEQKGALIRRCLENYKKMSEQQKIYVKWFVFKRCHSSNLTALTKLL